MQGWRKSMEDAHIARTDIAPPPSANVSAPAKAFAVFDGHGGAEVARFCQLYLVDVLTNEEGWCGDKVDVGEALIGCFHALDRLIDNPDRREEINSLRTEIPNPGERRTVKGSMLTTTGSEDQITDENIMVINSSEKTDDDSDGVNGEIGDDRLDSNEPMDSGNKTESAAGLFKKLLSINQGDKNAKPANVIEEDSPSNEEVNAITPTRILNGRQVRIPIRPTFLAFKNSVP